MESDATVQDNDSLKPTTSPSSIPTTLIPLSPYLDTLSLLCVMMALPEWLGCTVLISSILFGSSRAILGRCLSYLFTNLVTNNIYSHANNNSVSNIDGLVISLISPVLTSIFLDALILFASILVQHHVTNIIRISAYAVIASSLASYKTKTKFNSAAAIATIVAFQILYSFALSSFDLSGYTTIGFTQTYLTINHIYYMRKSWRFTLKFLIEFLNALLSIHICILGSPATKIFPFTSYTIPLTEISSSLNQSNSHNGQTSVRSENEILSIHVPKDISESSCPNLMITSTIQEDGVPASYPHEQLSNIEDISSSSLVVTQNFENYCILPSSNKKSIKRKASVRFSQPLWSLLVAIKAMLIAPGAYSGEDKSNALVAYSSSLAKNVTCYVFLTSETSIGLELVGCRPSKADVVVKINGVMWYQQDSVKFKETTIYVKISMLTRLSEYHVEVLYDLGDGEMESLANLIVSTSSNNPTLQKPIRSSPLITLQQSLETTLENINREKQNLKKLKKENQKRLTSYKNDITNRRFKLNNEKDERNHRKIMALKTAVGAYNAEYSKLSDEIMECYAHETEVEEIFQDSKRNFDLQFRELDKFEKDYQVEKLKYLNQIECFNQNLETQQAKNERLSKKFSKIIEEVSNIQNEVKTMYESDISRRVTLIETKQMERDDLLNQLKLELSKLDKELELAVTDNDMAKKQAI